MSIRDHVIAVVWGNPGEFMSVAEVWTNMLVNGLPRTDESKKVYGDFVKELRKGNDSALRLSGDRIFKKGS